MVFFIIGIVSALIDLGLIIAKEEGKDISTALIATISFLSGMFIFAALESRQVDPIDVYRGKTELYIHKYYIGDDLMKSDSTVIWKKKNKE